MDISELTPAKLAAMIDHTFLKPYGTQQDIEKLCHEACEYGFATVIVNPAEIERCITLLRNAPVRVGATVGFPLGQNTRPVKEYEINDAIARGASEIDMVLNIRALQSGELDIVRDEITALAKACEAAMATSKVILETCYLTDDQKRTACKIAMEEGVDYVKTSTGFGAAGATTEDVQLMRQMVGAELGVKASGGIRNLEAALAMIAAGATRLGASSGVTIITEMRRS